MDQEKPKLYLIAAIDQKGGIGLGGKLPWHLKADMEFFRRTTICHEDAQRRNMVIMGRKTWESIPESQRPLKGRKNVILTGNKDFKAEGAYVAHSLKDAMELADDRIASIFVMGGAKVYQQAISLKGIKGIYLTQVKKAFRCDAFFPKPPKFPKKELLGKGEEAGVPYEFWLYSKPASVRKLPREGQAQGARPNRSRSDRKEGSAGARPKKKR